MNQESNENAWSQESVLHYYDKNRLSTENVYPSEWFFLKSKLHDGISVLDVGCAKGFMANVLSENIEDFVYVGVDISQRMIDCAKEKFPQHRFFKVYENNYSILGNEKFDLVMCVGVLSIHESWRETLAVAWSHTKKNLIIDLRETHLKSIEDKNTAYFNMNFDMTNNAISNYTVPYNIINAAEAQKIILEICKEAINITHYGYLHPISKLAVSPINTVMTNVYCIERGI